MRPLPGGIERCRRQLQRPRLFRNQFERRHVCLEFALRAQPQRHRHDDVRYRAGAAGPRHDDCRQCGERQRIRQRGRRLLCHRDVGGHRHRDGRYAQQSCRAQSGDAQPEQRDPGASDRGPALLAVDGTCRSAQYRARVRARRSCRRRIRDHRKLLFRECPSDLAAVGTGGVERLPRVARAHCIRPLDLHDLLRSDCSGSHRPVHRQRLPHPPGAGGASQPSRRCGRPGTARGPRLRRDAPRPRLDQDPGRGRRTRSIRSSRARSRDCHRYSRFPLPQIFSRSGSSSICTCCRSCCTRPGRRSR